MGKWLTIYWKVKVESYFDETEFTTINMTEMADEAYTHYLDCNTDSDISTPEKFSYTKWDIWEETVRNLLHTKRVSTNLPLSYVVHKDTNPLTVDHSEFIIYNTSLTTDVLKSNRRKF